MFVTLSLEDALVFVLNTLFFSMIALMVLMAWSWSEQDG